jgi:hypothetical protein
MFCCYWFPCSSSCCSGCGNLSDSIILPPAWCLSSPVVPVATCLLSGLFAF